MKQWLWKNKIHLLIWALFAAYLMSAPQLYAAFFLRNGKPLETSLSLPRETGTLKHSVDKLVPIRYDNEDLFQLQGWAFSPDVFDSPNYQKKLVLHSTSRDLIFSTERVGRADVEKALKQYEADLKNSGFQALIAKDSLPVDTYQIGLILEDDQGRAVVFKMVNAYIHREPNRLRLSKSQ